MTIPAFRISFDPEFRKEFHEFCEQILDEGFLSDHTFVRRFEQDFSRFSGIPHAVAVSNGTAAIEAALLAIGVAGKEVLLPTNTFVATASAIESAGGIPIAVDIEKDGLGPDPDALRTKISAKTAAVIVVHAGGLISRRIREIVELCKSRGVPLIEDCAHAHGCSMDGVPAGGFGIAGCFSFFPTKVMTAGEGGMVLTRDPAFAEILKSVRRFGREGSHPHSHERRGSNLKMTEFQAALGILDLRRSPSRLRRRAEIAGRYQEKLRGSSWIPIVPAAGVTCTHYKQIVLSSKPAAWVEQTLAKQGVSLGGGVYHQPLHRQPYFRARFSGERFPVADWFAESHICPPCYPEMSDAEVNRICDLLLEL